jgi:hypothetical protein
MGQKMICVRVSEDWIKALEAWIEAQEIKPSKTAVIVAAVTRYIEGRPPAATKT